VVIRFSKALRRLTIGLTVLLPTDVQEPTTLRFVFECGAGAVTIAPDQLTTLR
jgi:hypothetical protein